jgi:uroporphyrinogen-III decarboxylase
MNTRERFLKVMRFEEVDRVPVFEFMGFWPDTVERWYQEGLPRDRDINESLGLEKRAYLPVDFDVLPRFDEEVLEEDEETVVVVDPRGVTKRKFKACFNMPHFIEFPIRNRRDYEKYIERLNPDDLERYPNNWDELLHEYKKRDYPLGLNIRGPFAFGRDFIDFDRLMCLFYDEPELMIEMFEFHADFTISLWKKAIEDVDVDFVVIGEDMAYKTGPMISPKFVREFLLPSYKRITRFLKNNGIDIIFVDSDGDIRSLIPIFLEAGITGVLPMEINANSDPYHIAKEYDAKCPLMIGGIDKTRLIAGRDCIKTELEEKLPYLLSRGGYIPCIDHLVPLDISLDDYMYYLDLLKSMVS